MEFFLNYFPGGLLPPRPPRFSLEIGWSGGQRPPRERYFRKKKPQIQPRKNTRPGTSAAHRPWPDNIRGGLRQTTASHSRRPNPSLGSGPAPCSPPPAPLVRFLELSHWSRPGAVLESSWNRPFPYVFAYPGAWNRRGTVWNRPGTIRFCIVFQRLGPAPRSLIIIY